MMSQEPVAPNSRCVIFAINPRAGALSQASICKDISDRLIAAGYETRLIDDIDTIVAEATEQHASGNLRAVVSAGGDGTVSLLANRLPPEIPIAILPLGTENLLAKHLEITAEPTSFVAMIQRGMTQRMDAGRANGQLFLVMASCGFDASVVHRLHANRRGHIRHWSYVRPIIDTITRYKYPELRLWIDDEEEPLSTRWVFLFNVPRYAMNLPFSPEADPADGLLDLCAFRQGSFARGITYLGAVIARQHRRWSDTSVRRFKKIRIESDSDVHYQLDGDPGGTLPLEIEVQPSFLRLFVKK